MEPLGRLVDFWSHFSLLKGVDLTNGYMILFENALKHYGENKFKQLIFKNFMVNNYNDLQMINTIRDSKLKLKKLLNIKNDNKMVQKHSYLGSTPKDLLCKIFRNLKAHELNTVSQVCRDFVGTARSGHSFHNKYFGLKIPANLFLLENKLMTYFNNKTYKHITKLIVSFSYPISLYDEVMSHKYRGLKLSDVFPKIVTLQVEAEEETLISMEFDNNIFGKFEHLKNLFLDKVDFIEPKKYSNLDILSIGHIRRISTDYTFDELAQFEVNVLSIYDGGVGYVLDGLDDQFAHTHLTGLRLTWFRPRKMSKSRLLCNSPNLKYLSVSLCHGPNDPELFVGNCNLLNVQEFHLKLDENPVNVKLFGKQRIDFYSLFGWTKKRKPQTIVIQLEIETIDYFIDYNLGLLNSLDVLKISIDCIEGSLLMAIFKDITDIWHDNNLVVPKHMLFIFNLDDSIKDDFKDDFKEILKLCSSNNFDRLKGCETLLLLYNAYTLSPLLKHDSNIVLQVSNEESQIACCHGIKSPFFNQFCFDQSLKLKGTNELHQIFYGHNDVYDIKRKLNYVNSIFDSANPKF